ncbi:uncharacterized protein METZ01_LOCUS464626 [marine metagenome]|uniref:Uncharacterized protein n=1 Tax=marine metagenome TaxID=408172 RepID=A0A383AVN4_9ZZZZ
MGLNLQASFAKLLKAVGHEFRLICSSEVDLEERMDKDEFFHDLFTALCFLLSNCLPLKIESRIRKISVEPSWITPRILYLTVVR